MQTRFIVLFCIVVGLVSVFAVPFPDGFIAVAVTAVLAGLTAFIFRRFLPDQQFVTNVFLLALALRMAFGLLVHIEEWRLFFGADAITYDFNGSALQPGCKYGLGYELFRRVHLLCVG